MEDAPNKMRVPPEVWKPRFLLAFSKTGNISHSARLARVDRSTVSEHRKSDSEFAKAFVEAKEIALENLEHEMWRRAYKGVDKPVYQGGLLVGKVREYSDTLMIFLAKALAPEKYRERFEQKVSVEGQDIKVKLDGVYEN